MEKKMEKNLQIVRRNSIDSFKQFAFLAFSLLFVAAQFQTEFASASILPPSPQNSLVQKFENEDEKNERRENSPAEQFDMANLANGVKFLRKIPDVEEFGPSDEQADDAARPMEKRNYQYIWRNVQMRMPVYGHNGQMSNSKRSVPASNQVLRHQLNTLYRLG